jgi:hypothetical protein
MSDGDYGDGPDQIPFYVPIVRTDTIVHCNRCGALVDGDVGGQAIHNVWYENLDHRIARAGNQIPTRYGSTR